MRNEAVYQTVCSICDDSGIPHPVAEHRFDPDRKWRFDFCWPDAMVALECEGAVWRQGRHTRGKGYIGDMEKYSEAAILGWCVIRTTWDHLGDGIRQVGRALTTRNYPAQGAAVRATERMARTPHDETTP